MDVADILREGLALHRQGRVQDALARYRCALDERPTDPSALNLAAVAHAALGEHDAAVRMLERCVRCAPDYVDAWANLGLAYRAVGRFNDSLAAQEKVLAQAPHDPEALNQAGITLRRLGRYNRAVELFARAIELAPRFAEAHANLGNALQDLDRMEDAVVSYRSAIDNGATQASVFRGLGNVLQRLHQLDDAVTAYRQAIAADPAHVASHTDLGGALVETGAIAEGVACLRHAAALAPRDPIVQSNLAMALHEAGEHHEALQGFERALALDPGNTHALAFQSIALHEAGEQARLRWLTGLDDLVRELELVPPPGYATLDALNEALAAYALSHPSVPGGRRPGISCELFLDGEGPPAALAAALSDTVRAYIDSLPATADHPFVRRAPREFVMSGWCNVLTQEGAASHIHPTAWLSGVYYVRTDEVVGDGVSDRAGCLEVGAPDEAHYRTEGYPVRVFRPREGRLVVFPSYVWHRVLPFHADTNRISYAFDVVPLR